MATVAERVIKRLRDEHGLDLPDDVYLRRLYPGHWQRARGMWSWSLWSDTNARRCCYGSQYPASDLLRCNHGWLIDAPNSVTPDLAIYPCTACQ